MNDTIDTILSCLKITVLIVIAYFLYQGNNLHQKSLDREYDIACGRYITK